MLMTAIWVHYLRKKVGLYHSQQFTLVAPADDLLGIMVMCLSRFGLIKSTEKSFSEK